MSNVEEVYINVPAVRDIAKTLGTVGETLEKVNKTLEMLSMMLKTTAFMGMVGGLAVANFIDTIRPRIEDMAEKCQELNKDVAASVDAYERGDQQGATRFY